MGWAEFGLLRNDYNEEFKAIDDKLFSLLQERKTKANGKRFFPPYELMEEWAKQYDMDISQINWFFHSINEGRHSYIPDGPGELLNVVPLMKKAIIGDFQYLLTHSMQHQNGSMITLEIEIIDKEQIIGLVRPHLMLEVIGKEEYQVSRHGSHGSEGQSQVQFLVTPRLPDQMEGISFVLVPYAMPMEEPPKEVVLNSEVIF